MTAAPNAVKPITLEEAFAITSMRRVLRALLRKHRTVRPLDARLVTDPLEYQAVSRFTDQYLQGLRQRVLSGVYVPQSPKTVATSKRNRLRRSVVHARLDDGVVLGTLMASLKPTLDEALPDWVSYGGKRKGRSNEGDDDDYDSWLDAFLRHRARSDRIHKNSDPFLVLTDIANFFPSIRLDMLRDRIQSLSVFERQALNLLMKVLRELAAGTAYDPFAVRGLPQEPDDHARLLATYFLGPVDERSRQLGANHKSARHADDMVFSAVDLQEADRILTDVQEVLGSLGLYVNSGKTRVVTMAEFEALHHPSENQRLESFDDDLIGPTLGDWFDLSARQFIRSARTGEWDRVLRRYYAIGRKLDRAVLAPYAWKHVDEFPESARYIVEYMQTVRPTETTAREFIRISNSDSYTEELRLTSLTALMHMPLRNRERTRRMVEDAMLRQIRKRLRRDDDAELDALRMLNLYRVGGSLTSVATYLKREHAPLAGVRQGYVLLRAEGIARDLVGSLPLQHNDPELWRIAHFMDRIEASTDGELPSIRDWLRPRTSTRPSRLFLRARALPLYRFLWRVGRTRQLEELVERVLLTLKAPPSQQRLDSLTIQRLAELTVRSR